MELNVSEVPSEYVGKFWNLVNRCGDSCWSWMMSKTKRGYGVFYFNGRRTTAHRFAYASSRGPIPENMCVCHTCDNPGCVNPDHLYLGTHNDNMRDKAERKRVVSNPLKAERHWNAKLKNQDVIEIRNLWKQGWKQKDIGNKFGITARYVCEIVGRRCWRSI